METKEKNLMIDGIKYPLNSKISLLENLEIQTLAVEFHCREGHCGACKCRLISGDVIYQTQPLAYLREGEILPCCCISKEAIQLSRF